MPSSQIEVQPFTLKDVDLEFDVSVLQDGSTLNNYKAHVSTVRFVPSSGSTTWKGLAPSASFTFGQKATWTCETEFAQDWETVDSLAQFLFDHEGEDIPCTFRPKAGGVGFSAVLTLAAPPIGGAIDTPATGSVTHGVKGKPQIIAAT